MAEDDVARDLVCFVIGPIGDKDAEPGSDRRKAYEDAVQILEEVIKPACDVCGLRTERADRITTPGDINEQVCRYIRDSHVVIADLTGANPNVMYELGLRHTTGKLTLQIGERETLPFDIAAIRTILFRRTEAGLVEARRKLVASLAAGLQSGGDPATATRVWFERATQLLPDPSTQEDDSEEPYDTNDEALGYLELQAEMSEGIDSATTSLGAISEVSTRIAEMLNEAAAHMRRANETGAPASARVSIANSLASRLNDPVASLEVIAGEFVQSIKRMDSGIRYLLEEARQKAEDESAVSFKIKIVESVDVFDQMFENMRGYREIMVQVGNATRPLRKVVGRIARSLDSVERTGSIFSDWKALAGAV